MSLKVNRMQKGNTYILLAEVDSSTTPMCSASAPCVFVYHANPLPTAPLPTCRSKPPTSLPTPLNISSMYTHAVQTPFYLLHQLGSGIGAEMWTRHPSSSSNPATSAVGIPDQATSTAHFGTSVDVSYNIRRLFAMWTR